MLSHLLLLLQLVCHCLFGLSPRALLLLRLHRLLSPLPLLLLLLLLMSLLLLLLLRLLCGGLPAWRLASWGLEDVPAGGRERHRSRDRL